MTLEFTPNGLSVQTYQEVFDELVEAYRGTYGTDINLDPDSQDGQRVGIEAKVRADMQAFALALYNQFDPDFSTGTILNMIIKLAGITRQPPARSQVDVTIVTDRDLTLSEGYAVLDDLDQTWVTTSEASLTSGSNTVTLFAENFGEVEADADTITDPSTIVIGVTSVTNPAAATPGRDEETDEELRIRRNKSLQSPATSTVGGMFAALADVAGVTDVIVYENDENTTDTDLDLGPHALWCIVQGGDVADIIETIAKNKTGGTALKGDVTGTYIEDLVRPNGSIFKVFHEMQFDRPVEAPLYITLDVENMEGVAVDTAAIEEALAERTFVIAENVDAGSLYSTVYSAGDGFVATNLQISIDDVTYTDGQIESDPDGVFTIDAANITITDNTVL